jgi:hypothetical protein
MTTAAALMSTTHVVLVTMTTNCHHGMRSLVILGSSMNKIGEILSVIYSSVKYGDGVPVRWPGFDSQQRQ